MKNCNPPVTYSNSLEVFETLGAIMASEVIKDAMSGRAFFEINTIMKNIEGIPKREEPCKQSWISPEDEARINENRAATVKYNLFKQLGNKCVDDPDFLEELTQEIEIIATNLEEIGDVPQKVSSDWFFNETLVKLYCVKDSDVLDGDELYVFGDLFKNGKKIEDRQFTKNEVDSTDTVEIDLTYKSVPIDIGKTVFNIQQLLVDDDGITDANIDELKKELGNLKEVIGKAATAKIKKYLEKVSSRSNKVSDAFKEFFIKLLVDLTIRGLDKAVAKLVDAIGNILGPDFFTPINFMVTINYDEGKVPIWSVTSTSQGKSSDSKMFTGQDSTKPDKLVHKELDKDDDGEYNSTNILRVFKKGKVI